MVPVQSQVKFLSKKMYSTKFNIFHGTNSAKLYSLCVCRHCSVLNASWKKNTKTKYFRLCVLTTGTKLKKNLLITVENLDVRKKLIVVSSEIKKNLLGIFLFFLIKNQRIFFYFKKDVFFVFFNLHLYIPIFAPYRAGNPCYYRNEKNKEYIKKNRIAPIFQKKTEKYPKRKQNYVPLSYFC